MTEWHVSHDQCRCYCTDRMHRSGHHTKGHVTVQEEWGSLEGALREAEALADGAIALLKKLRVICTNDGPNECEECPGYGFSPNTGAACGAVYQSPKQDVLPQQRS